MADTDMMEDRIETLEAKVEDLEAAQKPRPMSEAPRDGTRFHVVVPLMWWDGGFRDDDCALWAVTPSKAKDVIEHIAGWLPCPHDRRRSDP